jgi:hypothetical protein
MVPPRLSRSPASSPQRRSSSISVKLLISRNLGASKQISLGKRRLRKRFSNCLASGVLHECIIANALVEPRAPTRLQFSGSQRTTGYAEVIRVHEKPACRRSASQTRAQTIGAQTHSSRTACSEVVVKECGAFAGILIVSPGRTTDFSPRKVASISPCVTTSS